MRSRIFSYHPFAFALFPVLSLYAANSAQLSVSVLFIESCVVLFFALLLYMVFLAITRNLLRSALFASFCLLFVFSYGSFSALLMKINVGDFMFTRNVHRAPLYAALFGALAYIVVKIKSALPGLTKVLNFTAVVLLLIPAGKIGIAAAGRPASMNVPRYDMQNSNNDLASGKAVRPDIYYIILDGYARADTLKDVFGYDNSGFLSYLRNKGFDILDKGTSNYALTRLSIPSALHMGYFPETPGPLDNRIKTVLEKKGYTWYEILPGIGNNNVDGTLKGVFLNEFALLLWRSSVVDIFASRFNLYSLNLREQVTGSFDRLTELSEKEGPKFVFAHILAPHPPYVFGRNGEETHSNPLIALNIYKTSWDDKEGYVNQLVFVNRKMTEAIEAIQKGSKNPPIIVVQADHGPKLTLEGAAAIRTSMRILNALYLPAYHGPRLSRTMTPVNTFRFILNGYFDAHMEYLDDINYYSSFEKQNRFVNATQEVTGVQ